MVPFRHRQHQRPCHPGGRYSRAASTDPGQRSNHVPPHGTSPGSSRFLESFPPPRQRPSRRPRGIWDTNQGNAAAQTFDVPIKDYWGTTFAGKNKGLIWLTNYTNRTTENAERPHLVSIGGGRFIVLWEKWSLTAYSGTFVAVLDEYGNVLKAPASIGTARLHRQDNPVQFGDKAAWIIGESSPAKLVLYTLDANLILVRHEIR